MTETGSTCRHGVSTDHHDAANCAFYEDPEHLRATGPGRRPNGRPVADKIGGLRSFGVVAQSDGDVGLVLERRRATDKYELDLDQAEALGKSLTEMVTGLRERERLRLKI